MSSFKEIGLSVVKLNSAKDAQDGFEERPENVNRTKPRRPVSPWLEEAPRPVGCDVSIIMVAAASGVQKVASLSSVTLMIVA